VAYFKVCYLITYIYIHSVENLAHFSTVLMYKTFLMDKDEEKKQTEENEPFDMNDYRDGLRGVDHDGLFTSRSKANEEGLKEHAKLEEMEKREKEKSDDD
jgi:hypothetical protein